MAEPKSSGLNILLTVIAFVFIIGLLVMIFTIMGANLEDTAYEQTTSSNTNETVTNVSDTAVDLSVAGYRSVSCTVDECNNVSDIIPTSNYTESDCTITTQTTSPYWATDWKCTYSYIYDADTTASGVASDTKTSLAGVTTWFPIIIVITAMVVLILLTIIIITAIRGSGLVASA